MDVLIGGVGLVLLIAALFGINNPKVYEDLRIPLDTRGKRVAAVAVGIVFISIGLGWVRPPSTETANTAFSGTPGPALVAGATSSSGNQEASATATATTDTSPSPAPHSVSRRTLHWTSASNGSVLDGGLYTPGKAVLMEEAFPGRPPSEFSVVETVDPALGTKVRDALRALDPGPFDVVANGGQAVVSRERWSLPAPVPGMGLTRTFSFRDTNPDGASAVSSSIVSGYASVSVKAGTGCLTPSADGRTFQATSNGGCIDLLVQAPQDPELDPVLLVPWTDDDTGLQRTIDSSFQALATALAEHQPSLKFSPAAAMDAFLSSNGPFLPSSAPWGVGVPGEPLQVGPGKSSVVRVQISPGGSGQAMIALKLVDPARPANSVISPLFRIVVAGPTAPASPTGSSPSQTISSSPSATSVATSSAAPDSTAAPSTSSPASLAPPG